MANELSRSATLSDRVTTLRSTISEAAIAIAGLAVRVSANCAALLRSLQLARMRSVLMGMSDEQLARIGITRSEISSYARSLVIDE